MLILNIRAMIIPGFFGHFRSGFAFFSPYLLISQDDFIQPNII